MVDYHIEVNEKTIADLAPSLEPDEAFGETEDPEFVLEEASPVIFDVDGRPPQPFAKRGGDDVAQVVLPHLVDHTSTQSETQSPAELYGGIASVEESPVEQASLNMSQDVSGLDYGDISSLPLNPMRPLNARSDVTQNSSDANKPIDSVSDIAIERDDSKSAIEPGIPKVARLQPVQQPVASTSPSHNDFQLAGQPKIGDQWNHHPVHSDRRTQVIDGVIDDFSPDPIDPNLPFDPAADMQVYDGKVLNANQRPLIELGIPWYQLGQLPEPSTVFGFHNPVTPQFVLFGDYRTAVASNTASGGDNVSQLAWELNLNFNLQLTGTERLHMFISPFDNGKNSRYLFDDDRFDEEMDADVDFGYFEGDLGAMVGGVIGETMPFDLPFAVGVMPLLAQNGIWMEDAFLGVAATIPARNSARWDISNMDVTFFAGFDEINSAAFEGNDDVAKMYGVMSFIEANDGYWELDYAFLEDRNNTRDRSYHNIGIGFTRRYGTRLSNSTRVIVNAGQSTAGGPNTADGVLLLSENSIITSAPSTVVPYLNFFAGFDRPQSVARAGQSGGILRNTGILFESDGMTGYPTLDASANDTFGAAFGLNLMPNDFSQQLVMEAAMLGVMGDTISRNAAGDQYGLGFRYQLPLTNAVIFRTDGMFGFLRGQEDISGLRFELRHKF